MREHRRLTREMFVSLSHPPDHIQCDFSEALVLIGGVQLKAHCFILDLFPSNGCFVRAYPAETRAFSSLVWVGNCLWEMGVIGVLGGSPAEFALLR